MTGALLASSAKTHGLSRLVTDLLTHPEGMEFYRVVCPPSLVGTAVGEAIRLLKDRHDTLLVGVFGNNGRPRSTRRPAARWRRTMRCW
jgi:hypothetical protein